MNVIGVGGVFWRSRNIKELKKWYSEVLGLALDNEWSGTIFPSQEGNETIFSLFKEDSDYFPKEQQVMLNFQVEDMNECLNHLKKLGVPLLKQAEKSEFGTFTWIADPEGRWIELWAK
ncbi:putative enzyme related to lactoylglutathione lyase [Bacillus niacini]|uniref:Enzyme related to lactoylglutathione lyase n=1 Tax=Neobacillus niacini TaxID=86668 RepID=A0A852T5L2_9BACI|nr:VOC family protein [Neobacillus niacini]NYE04002.1 putative enzyme related to lactoylglutathione lyase [Neobacillus niacini]